VTRRRQHLSPRELTDIAGFSVGGRRALAPYHRAAAENRGNFRICRCLPPVVNVRAMNAADGRRERLAALSELWELGLLDVEDVKAELARLPEPEPQPPDVAAVAGAQPSSAPARRKPRAVAS
jgi:hypothetical protein